jgi:hypothetical protein
VSGGIKPAGHVSEEDCPLIYKRTGRYGKIRVDTESPSKHFACQISAIGQNDWNVRLWPIADIRGTATDVRR